jgi:hypothetical protein
VTDSVDNAAKYVRSPSFDPGAMDFYPLPGKCQGTAIDLSPFHQDSNYTLDFNGRSKIQEKGAIVFRGAYAGEGANQGWGLQAAIKPAIELPSIQTATLVRMSPEKAQAGTSTLVTLTGANFTTEATVAVSGTGVTVGKVTIADATQLTATLMIARDTLAGTRDVTVTTPSGASNAFTFRITPRQSAKKP